MHAAKIIESGSGSGVGENVVENEDDASCHTKYKLYSIASENITDQPSGRR